MSNAEEIIHNIKTWKQLSQRQARETLRTVFLADNRYIVKMFDIPAQVKQYRRPWIQEHEALTKSPAGTVPASLGFTETVKADRRMAYLVKDFVPGIVCDHFEDSDMPEAARLLACLHRHGIITDDANVHNFLKQENGQMLFIDMGRALVYPAQSAAFLFQIGRELAKFRREGISWNKKQWEVFILNYFNHYSCSRFVRFLILSSCTCSNSIRFIRKSMQSKKPW